MKKTAMLRSIVVAAATLAAGLPVAAQAEVAVRDGLRTAQATQPQQRPGEPGSPGSIPERVQRTPDSPSTPAPGGMAPEAKPSSPPQSTIGKDVVSAEGKKVGEVKKVIGNQVIVSIGGFLGIGAHEVALLWKDLTLSGAGDQTKLQTAMSEKELEALPRYEDPERARPSREGGGAGYGGSPPGGAKR